MQIYKIYIAKPTNSQSKNQMQPDSADSYVSMLHQSQTSEAQKNTVPLHNYIAIILIHS